ncbi:hypothetical protein C8J56DRAFT_1043430 [Mycena floridula]|nr:hypothetical protein C8J56DRAFT_1043430 [Mycena floridula]
MATVCSLWRSIAVSTPSLWSTIMLGGDHIEKSREDYEADNSDSDSSARIFPEDVLEVALESSAQHPLTLWIDLDGLDDDKLMNVLQSVPSLTRLAISMFKAQTTIPMLEKLACSPTVPRLKFLNVWLAQTKEAIDAVVHCVAARTLTKGHLEELVICMRKGAPKSVKKRLADGLTGFAGIQHNIRESYSNQWCCYDPWFDEWMSQVQNVW